MSKQARRISYAHLFRGEAAFAAAGSGSGSPFVKADTSSAGAPTVGGITGGGVRLALDSTNEIQNLCLFMGDVLPFDIDDIIGIEVKVKCSASLDATTQIAFGLASARNDAIDSIAAAALFRCVGDNNVVVETDDGTNDNDDVATGLTLEDSWKRFSINFAERNHLQGPPSLSLGRKSHIGFYGSNANGSKRRVASGTRFDMTNYSGGLQFFFQIQKTADTNTDYLDILDACIEVNEDV